MPRKDPDERRAYQREYIRRNYERHLEHSKEAMRRWRECHPDEHRAGSRVHYARDPERHQRQLDASPNRRAVRIAAKHRRRERGAAGGPSFTYTEWLVLLAQHRCCAYCGAAGPLQVDHRTPLARGGTNSIDNILPACGRCNQRKHTLTEPEFRARLARERKRQPPYN